MNIGSHVHLTFITFATKSFSISFRGAQKIKLPVGLKFLLPFRGWVKFWFQMRRLQIGRFSKSNKLLNSWRSFLTTTLSQLPSAVVILLAIFVPCSVRL